ncbi:MAG: tRNA (adenosine(37)-N6)-threonylcarbamoyltransferase complex ATPase subunit type 1 TsaE [bacterium]|nr:tRNA (adenosine(37)-N6)-threonylcarbamoyltransferase complex ATPase subunit type 1 TsaE [bacterium]MDZ4295965.1 tRNA (adenosine(37)-N6)-threonylcarbamoyltransferase complex ATPase subunit type 1 TsaE [Patescibacteria group bacterium]
MARVIRSVQDLKKAASDLVELLGAERGRPGARVLALVGDLGSGKTALTQCLAEVLGVRERIQSPTFVIMRSVPTAHEYFQTLWHIDCYRLDNGAALSALGFKDVLQDQSGLVVIEWADRVRELLPEGTLWVTLTHGAKEGERRMSIKMEPKFSAPGGNF